MDRRCGRRPLEAILDQSREGSSARRQVFSGCSGDGETNAEDVYHDANHHHSDRERVPSRGRQRHYHSIHKKVNGHTIQCTRNSRVLQQEAQPATSHNVNSSRAIRDDEVEKQPKRGSCDSASEGARSQHSCRDSLEKAKGLGAEEAINDESCSNVQNTAGQASPKGLPVELWTVR